jgi:hypothetical protein
MDRGYSRPRCSSLDCEDGSLNEGARRLSFRTASKRDIVSGGRESTTLMKIGKKQVVARSMALC